MPRPFHLSAALCALVLLTACNLQRIPNPEHRDAGIETTGFPFQIISETGPADLRKAEDMRHVILVHRSELNRLYGEYLAEYPDLKGTVAVRMTIRADGVLGQVEVSASNTGRADFDEALLNLVEKWRFRPVAAGEVIGIHRFNFSAGH